MDPHRPRSPPEDTRLLTKPNEVRGNELLALLDCKATYQAYDRGDRLVQTLDARRVQMLSSRGLLVGRLDRRGDLKGLWLAPGATAAQIKNVMRLKPASVSIANKATVFKELPSTWTHRTSWLKGL